MELTEHSTPRPSTRPPTNDGRVYHLRGHAELKSADVTLRADSIDYDEDNAAVHLAGNVIIETRTKGILRGDEADYDVNSGDVRLKANLNPRP